MNLEHFWLGKSLEFIIVELGNPQMAKFRLSNQSTDIAVQCERVNFITFMSANKVYKLTLSHNNIDAKSSSRVKGDIFVRFYKVSSACAVSFSVSGDTKAVNSRHFLAIVAAASPNVDNNLKNEIKI